MNPNDFFGSKLGIGKAVAPPKTTWWQRHSAAMTRYLLTSHSSLKKDLQASWDALTVLAGEWEAMVPCAAMKVRSGFGFMVDHARLERELLGAMLLSDTVAVKNHLEQLSKNMLEQGLLYEKAFKNFPLERWSRLGYGHVDLFVLSTRSLVEGHPEEFDRWEQKRRENTVALAYLTTEYF